MRCRRQAMVPLLALSLACSLGPVTHVSLSDGTRLEVGQSYPLYAPLPDEAAVVAPVSGPGEPLRDVSVGTIVAFSDDGHYADVTVKEEGGEVTTYHLPISAFEPPWMPDRGELDEWGRRDSYDRPW